MKLTCPREKLAALFNLAASVVPTRSPKPILSNVKLEAGDGNVVLMATDMEIGLRAEMGDIAVESPGVVVLPAKHVSAILRESDDDVITIETEGNKTVIHGLKSHFQLPTQDPNEFPNVAPFEAEQYFTASASLFREAARRTAFATDEESSRYALGGVLLEFEGDTLTAVGTDGRRLASQFGPTSAVGNATAPGTTVVPTRSLHIIERALTESSEDVRISIQENSISVQSGGVMIFSRLVEGRYPRWRDVFPPEEGMIEMDVIVGPLSAVVRQASILTERNEPGVDFVFGQGKLEIFSHGKDVGDSQVELPIPYDGEPIRIRLDPFFIMDFLRMLEPERSVQVAFKDEFTAARFRTDDGYSYVIMPMADD